MLIKDLWVTQNALRDYCQLKQMVDFVISGGFWTQDVINKFSNKQVLLIQISEFEDGVQYVHDGHHRVIATLLGGRDYLRQDEYEVKTYTYERYMTAKPHINYFTPFDPRIHVRKADLFEFKLAAKKVYQTKPDQFDIWIQNNVDKFREMRYDKTTLDFLEKVKVKYAYCK